VVDASAMVDLLLDEELAPPVGRRLAGRNLHAPAHFDAEVLSALGRLYRAGVISGDQVEIMLANFVASRVQRHSLRSLLQGAWRRRDQLRLVDAIYAELAEKLDLQLVTTDKRLRDQPNVDVVAIPRD
jgi:predicted nucleic acid-binding protein